MRRFNLICSRIFCWLLRNFPSRRYHLEPWYHGYHAGWRFIFAVGKWRSTNLYLWFINLQWWITDEYWEISGDICKYLEISGDIWRYFSTLPLWKGQICFRDPEIPARNNRPEKKKRCIVRSISIGMVASSGIYINMYICIYIYIIYIYIIQLYIYI